MTDDEITVQAFKDAYHVAENLRTLLGIPHIRIKNSFSFVLLKQHIANVQSFVDIIEKQPDLMTP
jgi:hypothetical protein